MTHRDPMEHPNKNEDNGTKSSGETHSGTPNPDDQNKNRSVEHKSGYGGEAGKPRTPPDTK